MIPARGKLIGSYVNSALIKSDALLSGYDEALVLSQDGHVAEASAANFFMVRDGVVVTPPITDNVLEGITRRTMMHLCTHALGLPVVERSIDRTELFLADEAFLTTTFPAAIRPSLAGFPLVQQAVEFDVGTGLAHASPCGRQRF